MANRFLPAMHPRDRVALVVLAMVLMLLAVVAGEAATLVVANKAEATVSLVDLDSGEVRATLPTGEAPHEVAVSLDGRLALVSNYGTRQIPGSTLTLIDVPTAQVVRTIELGEYRRPHGLAWLADGRQAVVTAEVNQALLVIDAISGEVAGAVPTGQEVSHMVAVTPDGRRAFVANIRSGSVTAVDLEKRQVIASVATGEGAEGVAVTPDGRQVWVTNRAADTVSVLDAVTLEMIATLPSPAFPIRAAVTPDGAKVLITAAKSGDIKVFDVASRALARAVPLEVEATETTGRLFGDAFGTSSVPIGIVISPEGQRAFVAHANADVISVVDVPSGQRVGTLRAGKEPDGMGFSPLAVEVAKPPVALLPRCGSKGAGAATWPDASRLSSGSINPDGDW